MNESTSRSTVILSFVVILALISGAFSFWTQNRINRMSRTLEYLYKKLEKLHTVKQDIILNSKTIEHGADSLIQRQNVVHDLVGYVPYDKLRPQWDKLNKINRYVLLSNKSVYSKLFSFLLLL